MAEPKVFGIKELNKTLAHIRKVATSKNMRLAGNAGMLEIINDAKKNAPVLSGTLRRSLHVGGDPSGDFSPSSDGGQYEDIGDGPTGSLEIVVWGGTNVDYAPDQEFGTEFIAAQPYLRPAVTNKKGAAARVAGLAFGDILKSSVRVS